ncbi:MAG TPA: hypothetical protein VIJ51_01225 [Solirubrobacteraceae bacterium]
MNRKLITMSAAAAVLAFGVTAASADTTVIGSTGQSNQQGVNSGQSAENGSGGGSTYILGDSTPTTTQNSENILVNVQDVGSLVGATTTLIAPGNDCFCQSSQQGVNSSQVAANGDGGGTMTAILGDSSPALTQNSENIGVNVELIGAGFGGDTTLIGGSAQTNDQAFNSAQSGENTSGASGTLVVTGDSLATLDQNSANALINVALLGS